MYSRHSRLFTISLLGVGLSIASYCVGIAFAAAPNWTAPLSVPPINNPGQPPNTDNLTDYVRKSRTILQSVQGPVQVNTSATDKAVNFGMGNSIAIQTQDTAVPVGYAYPQAHIGVHGYGSQYGVYGYSDSATAAGAAGVVGQSSLLSTHEAAAEFYGPVQVKNRDGGSPYASTEDSQGSVTLEGILTTGRGLICSDSSCGTGVAASPWLQATNLGNGTALFGTSITGPGIKTLVGSDTTSVSGPAISTYCQSINCNGLMGYVDPLSIQNVLAGIYGKASGSIANNTYYGIAGINNADTGTSTTGITYGGLGSKDYDNSLGLNIDMVAGIRACVRDDGGNIVNKYGIKGIGGEYAGYFDGDAGGSNDLDDGNIMVTGTLAGGKVNVLTIGNTTMTKKAWQVILCKTYCGPFSACGSECTAVWKHCLAATTCSSCPCTDL